METEIKILIDIYISTSTGHYGCRCYISGEACCAFYAPSAPPLRRNELKVDKNAGSKCQHYLLFVNDVVFLIILWVTLNCIWQTSTSDVECTFMPYPTIRLIPIVHLNAGIITALMKRNKNAYYAAMIST